MNMNCVREKSDVIMLHFLVVRSILTCLLELKILYYSSKFILPFIHLLVFISQLKERFKENEILFESFDCLFKPTSMQKRGEKKPKKRC